MEAIMIAQENPAMSMNSKAEWGLSNTIPGVRVVDEYNSQNSAQNQTDAS